MKSALFICLMVLILTGCNGRCTVDTTSGSESECADVSVDGDQTTITITPSGRDIVIMSDARSLIVIVDNENVSTVNITGDFEELSFSASQIVPTSIVSSILKKTDISFGEGTPMGGSVRIFSPQLESISIDSSDVFYLNMTITEDLNVATSLSFADVKPTILALLLTDAVYPPSDGLRALAVDGAAEVEEEMKITVYGSDHDISEWRSMFPEDSNVKAGSS